MTRSRLWIAVIAALLTGIVALNVWALSLTAQTTGAERLAASYEQETAELAGRISAGGSNERLGRVADELGLLVPEPGAVRYLAYRPRDAALAAERLRSGELAAAAAVATDLAAPAAEAPVEASPPAPAQAETHSADTAPQPAPDAQPEAPAPPPPAAAPTAPAAPSGGGGGLAAP